MGAPLDVTVRTLTVGQLCEVLADPREDQLAEAVLGSSVPARLVEAATGLTAGQIAALSYADYHQLLLEVRRANADFFRDRLARELGRDLLRQAVADQALRELRLQTPSPEASTAWPGPGTAA